VSGAYNLVGRRLDPVEAVVGTVPTEPGDGRPLTISLYLQLVIGLDALGTGIRMLARPQW